MDPKIEQVVSFLLAAGIIFYLISQVRERRAHDYVITNRWRVLGRFDEIKEMAFKRGENSVSVDVQKLTELKTRATRIRRLTAGNEHVDWVDVKKRLVAIEDELDQLLFFPDE